MHAGRLLLVGIVLLGGCRRTPPAETARRVVIATSQEPDVLLPAFAEMSAANQVVEGGVRYLTQYDREWNLVPGLAVRMPTLANGDVVLLDAAGKDVKDPTAAQQMRVTWKLRPDARWADGQPLTAQDFLFAHEVMLDPRQEVRDRTIVEKIARMEAPDAHTLVVHWREVNAFYGGFRNHHVFPRHAMSAAWRPDGGSPVGLKTASVGRQPLFYGPFAFDVWKPGEFIRLKRNPHAFVRPVVEEVLWQFIPKETSAIAALETGTVDAIAPDGTVGVDAADALVKRRPGEFVADFHPGMSWAHIDVNTTHPWLADKRMRQALLMALDREAAIKSIYSGRYDVSHGLFPTRHPGHHAGLKRYGLNAEGARALLDQLGWKPGKDGIRVNDKGEPLRLELAYATGQKASEDLLLTFQSNLKAVGVDLVLKGSPAKVFFGDILRKRAAPHLTFYAWTMDPQAYAETLLASSKIPDETNGWAGQNYVGYRNAEVDALIQRIPRELDEKARQVHLRRLNDIFVEDLPMLPIYTRPVVSIRKASLKNWAPTGTQTSVSWNCETWAP